MHQPTFDLWVHRRFWWGAACVVVAAAIVAGMSSVFVSAQGAAQVRVLSNPRPDRVSGGDVLIQVDIPAGTSSSDVRVSLNGTDVTSNFRADAGGLTMKGLVTRLVTGTNTVAAQVQGGEPAVVRPLPHLPVGLRREDDAVPGRHVDERDVDPCVRECPRHRTEPARRVQVGVPDVGRVDVIGDPNAIAKNPDQWFNTAAFRAPDNGKMGNFLGPLLGPATRRLDLSLRKVTPLHENWNLVIAGEAFNLTNTPQFGPPINNLRDARFGRSINEGGGLGANTTGPYGARIIQIGARIDF
jgi:hypothetical protein